MDIVYPVQFSVDQSTTIFYPSIIIIIIIIFIMPLFNVDAKNKVKNYNKKELKEILAQIINYNI